jgi:hypothetical protein
MVIELPGQPRVEVRLTLQGHRVSIQAIGGAGATLEGWALIGGICIEGALAAYTEWLRLEATTRQTLVVPSLAAPTLAGVFPQGSLSHGT